MKGLSQEGQEHWGSNPVRNPVRNPGEEFKLTGPTAVSHAVGEHLMDGGSIIEDAVRDCSEVKSVWKVWVLDV